MRDEDLDRCAATWATARRSAVAPVLGDGRRGQGDGLRIMVAEMQNPNGTGAPSVRSCRDLARDYRSAPPDHSIISPGE